MADHDPKIREFLIATLEKTKAYSLRGAASGKEALLKIGQEIPDLLVINITMPDMDGLDVCRLIGQISELADIKVVIITGAPDSPMAAEIAKMGFNHMIIKPLDMTDLQKTIDKILETEQ